jgi:ribosome-binding factor A
MAITRRVRGFCLWIRFVEHFEVTARDIQGVTTQIEKVVVQADFFHAQQFLPPSRKNTLDTAVSFFNAFGRGVRGN